MDDETEQRLRMVEARVEALIQLTLSHIVASAEVASRTVLYAEDQRREAVDQSKHLTGIILGDLIAQLREVLDLTETH